MKSELAGLQVVRRAPHVSLTNPSPSPGIYSDFVDGSGDRVDPKGNLVAAYWQYLQKKKGDGEDSYWKEVCVADYVTDMRLRDDQGRSAPLVMFTDDSLHEKLSSYDDSCYSHLDNSTFTATG